MCIVKAELSLLGMELDWHSFCHNLATQLSGRLLIISYQITIDLEMKTFSQQRWGQTRQSPDRTSETGPPHPKPKQCTVTWQERTNNTETWLLSLTQWPLHTRLTNKLWNRSQKLTLIKIFRIAGCFVKHLAPAQMLPLKGLYTKHTNVLPDLSLNYIGSKN